MAITLNSWNDFHSSVIELRKRSTEAAQQNGGLMSETLFRGLGNAEWTLKTTLERSPDVLSSDTLLNYYRRVSRCKPAVDSLTNRKWDDIPGWQALKKLLQEPGEWLDQILSKNLAIYEFLIYMRHHGCPSPLLDWTVSPYIAAMFAFDSMDPSAQVCRDPRLRTSPHAMLQ